MALSNERELVRRPCVGCLRELQALNQLQRYPFLYWACPPDFGKQAPHIARKLKLDGYSKGNFDMTIIAANEEVVKVWLIEFKYGKNKYTPEQQAIADACEATPVQAYTIYSVDEFQTFLEENLK
jgi:hypothetical protein